MTGQNPGFELQVDLTPEGGSAVPYSVARCFVGSSVAPIDTGNSEGHCGNPAAADSPGYATVLPDLKKGQLRLTSATWDSRNNPFAAPLDLDAGDYIEVQIYPQGRGTDPAAAIAHDFQNCLVLDVQHESSIPGAQPITLTLQTDGYYRLAGGAITPLRGAKRKIAKRGVRQPRGWMHAGEDHQDHPAAGQEADKGAA